MTRRAAFAATCAVVVAVLAPCSAQAQGVPCASVAAYPGDASPAPAIAQWMAYGAGLASIPRELPVMGALVESGLRNLRYADADSAGYFQMRLAIWNQGAYAGYPDNPPLQLKWFLDQATRVRQSRLAAGQPDPAIDENGWGAWIADTLTPAEARRGDYQPRLGEARVLVGAPCAGSGVGGPTTPPTFPLPTADRTAPVLSFAGARRQRALRAGAIVTRVRCPAEPCTTAARASIALPGARRALIITLKPRLLSAGQRRQLRFVLSRNARRRIGAALRSHPSVKVGIRVTASDALGNDAVATRTVRVVR